MSQEDYNIGRKVGKEIWRITLATICGGGVGSLLVLLLENRLNVEMDVRFLVPVLCVMFVSARNSIFK